MPPKKAATETAAAKGETLKPEEAQFMFECLKAFGDDGLMDFSVLCRAAGHTNLMSTKNAFNRYKKRYGFGNIPTKTGDGQVTAKPTDDGGDADESILPSIETDILKPKSNGSKVTKKRGRPAAKATASTASTTTAPSKKKQKKAAAVSKSFTSVNDASDEDDVTEEDDAAASANVKHEEGEDETD